MLLKLIWKSKIKTFYNMYKSLENIDISLMSIHYLTGTKRTVKENLIAHLIQENELKK